MSLAGIRSNRGDNFQTLVAFDWALSVLSDPEYQWIEVDSVTWSVDDVVVGKSDGIKICCQCKKNQPDFNAWTIADLADEIKKATNLLATEPTAVVRFYSRGSFGAVAKLREHSATQPNESSYQASLTAEHKKTDAELAKRIAGPHLLSTYEFLRRTTFEISPEFDRMQTLIRERLHRLVSNSDTAYDAFWRQLIQLGARLEGTRDTSVQHRLTKEDFKTLLHHSGSLQVPIMATSKLRSSFTNISAIGRTWRRDIAGVRVSNSTTDELLAAIDARKRSILLTGSPGAGKTCVMLEVQEILEQRAKASIGLTPVFIQSREFADFGAARDRQAQGLPEQWVEEAARLSEEARVVVMIDSLDVLSISREHSILTYFLAQIDRLLLIPNITVVVACRDFDRHYDRRIAERRWDTEVKCSALSWNRDVEPLLQSLAIDMNGVDAITRDLIRNPRELALFVELAKREGGFSVVTSQALAQRYLDSIVRADPTLGETAVEAIESIANEMLKSRSLAVPRQRFNASQAIQRALLSQNILHETQDGKLTFGHQTLLDVLVISNALRTGVKLKEFIQDLAPVPFVRPSIRSFVTQLATGDRREFRKQIRAVMTSNIVFHIRRMVAEAFAAQKPEDEDWQLLRELRRKNRDVFQVIYTHAKSIDWHHFWFKYLVPVLREDQDAEGIAAHVHRVAQWASQDAAGVLTFWEEALFLPWIEHIYIARQVILHLTEFDLENAASTTSLIKKLLNAPDQEHSFLGRAIARCMSAGGGDDSMLWQFIAGNITDNDALAFKFGEKLRCGAHEFGGSGNEFLIQRMKQSTALLDMAVQSVEHWSQIRISTKGDWIAGSMGFLGDTSYEDVHSNKEIRHQDNDRLLFDAIEGAIFEQARMNSQWWITHCDRLAFSQEGALRYFAILACTAYPANNIALIERMLSDKALLESELSYEIGNLIKASFVSLISDAQDTITAEILNIHDDSVEEEHLRRWLLYKRARLIATIPCHMRSKETQIGLDSYERIEGPILNQPEIMSHGGMVIAPFSFEVFLNMADAGVLRLMRHYAGYSNKNGADFLIGGESEVGGQLREAASRQTTRFLCLLKAHWAEISDRFRDEIVRGISNYLFYRFGNLQADSNWKPLEEPIPDILAHDVLNELERHSSYWRHDRAAADALLACAHVIADIVDANRLVFLALGFCNFEEVRPIVGGKVDLINNGINMVNGHIAEAMIILAKRLRKANISYPELLHPMLRRFAGHKEPAFRALILRRLPYLQSLDPDLGWELFDLAVEGDATDLWEIAEPCLYYSYHCNFEIISPILARIRTEGKGKDLETWGRISTLAALTNRVKFTDLLEDLNSLNCEAWRGAAAVWTNHQNMKQYREQCLTGIKEGLNNANRECASLMATCLVHAFRPNDHLILMPTAFIRSFFEILEVKTENRNAGLIQFDEWLNAVSQRDTDLALGAAEIYLAYLSRTRAHVYDVNDSLPKLLTRLFAEAEEREESDNGEMLQRVVALQDTMLALGINGVNEWLAAAERP